jgi:NAD(P)-dependent dehydrogenase (short-subunit alcohol dehydrogenase family)
VKKKKQAIPTFGVIGASGGIGEVVVKVAHERGFNVGLASRTEADLQRVAASLDPKRSLIYPSDASIPGQVEQFLKTLKKRFGHVDVLVISTGRWDQLLIDDSARQAEDLFSKHVRGIMQPSFMAAFVAQQFFRQQGGGLIVHLSSHVVQKPDYEGNLSYRMAKSGISAMLEAMQYELAATKAGKKVRILDLMPGTVNTPGNALWLKTEADRHAAIQPKEIAEVIIANLDNPHPDSPLLMESKKRVKVKRKKRPKS